MSTEAKDPYLWQNRYGKAAGVTLEPFDPDLPTDLWRYRRLNDQYVKVRASDHSGLDDYQALMRVLTIHFWVVQGAHHHVTRSGYELQPLVVYEWDRTTGGYAWVGTPGEAQWRSGYSNKYFAVTHAVAHSFMAMAAQYDRVERQKGELIARLRAAEESLREIAELARAEDYVGATEAVVGIVESEFPHLLDEE